MSALLFKIKIGDDGVMVADLPGQAGILADYEFFIGKNIVNAERGRNAIKGTANTGSFLSKRIFQAMTDLVVRIAVGNIIKIAANNYRVRAFIDLLPHVIALFFSFQEANLELANDIF